jgi:hypothetical protein
MFKKGVGKCGLDLFGSGIEMRNPSSYLPS